MELVAEVKAQEERGKERRKQGQGQEQETQEDFEPKRNPLRFLYPRQLLIVSTKKASQLFLFSLCLLFSLFSLSRLM